MFERELIEPMFLDRWTIVRTLMRQSVADHTYLVCHYANDICVFLGVSTDIHLAVLQKGIWHDVDEQFTGDLPGPNKRGLLDAIGPEASKKWKQRLQEWTERTFKNHYFRSGGHAAHLKDPYINSTGEIVDLILKVADWLEAATRMATESQMGNQCAYRHIGPNLAGALEVAKNLLERLTGHTINLDEVPFQPNPAEVCYSKLEEMFTRCVENALSSQSEGPWITREDAKRTYHDPCVDTPVEKP